MSISSPVHTRQPRQPLLPSQAASSPPPRGEAAVIVVRSILFAVAAISVIATSNYFAYLIGRKQVAYEELRRQVDRVVQLVDRTRAEDELLPVTTLKQRQERLEQTSSSLTGLTTSTINGKTVATPEPSPDGKPMAAVLTNDAAGALDHEVSLQPAESSPSAAAKPHDKHVVSQRRPRRPRVPPTLAAPGQGQAGQAFAAQSGQITNAARPAPDAGLAGQ